MADATDEDGIPEDVGFGTEVYDAEGQLLGQIRGFDEDGFFVTVRGGHEGLSERHVRSGGEFGEAELMWRCTNCGEMGDIDAGLPDTCPDCGHPKEELMYWTED